MKPFFTLLFLFPALLSAQNENTPGPDLSLEKSALTLSQHNMLMNRFLSKQAGTDQNGDQLGNYASFDPSDGKFIFKGSMPIGNPDSAKFSFLGLSVNGDLISDNYTALFSGYKLNTNVSFQAQYNFKLSKGQSLTDNGDVALAYFRKGLNRDRLAHEKFTLKEVSQNNRKKYDLITKNMRLQELIIEKQQKDIDVLSENISKSHKWLSVLDSLSNELKRKKIEKRNPELSAAQKASLDTEIARRTRTIDSLKEIPTNIQADKNLLDSIQGLYPKLEKAIKEKNALKFQADSLKGLIQWQTDIISGMENELYTAQSEKDMKALSKITLDGLKLNWFSVTAAAGLKNYYTFDTTRVFSDQIKGDKLLTFRFGANWYYFNINTLYNRFIYLNAGLFLTRDNNTHYLSTTEINQESVFKNAAGDTTRKAARKYNAYTDPITQGVQWQINANFYYLFGSRTSGLHLEPTFAFSKDLPSNLKLNLGYVISFQGKSKETPLINAELYLRINDLTRNLDTRDKYRTQDEIGVRIGLPFAFIL
ncbi:MAG: hypothetical protein QHC79_25590 [Pseudosphingobacterium sp.]|nr:hypothetical protein [Pseudosphingobacterium sp.]